MAAKEIDDLEALRKQIKGLVCKDAVAMVEKIVAQVGDGHYQAMKYLFEMIGLFPATATEEAPQEDSLAGMLLSRLGTREEMLNEAEEGSPRLKA